MTQSTTPTAASNVKGTLGTTTRTDGSKQVTFGGWPLYPFSGDSASGQVNGQAFENTWYVLPAKGFGVPSISAIANER
ncbi:MAG: hypothetical protein ACRD6W_13180 [Nitrososphaerales archaeon]